MSLHHMLRAAAGNAGPSDPYFEYNTLLLTGNGTNGAQNNTFLDSSTNNFTITRNGNTTQGTFSPYGNLWSNYFNGTTDYLTVADNAAFAIGTGDFEISCWVFITSLAANRSIVDKRLNSGGSAPWILYTTTDGKINWFDGTNYASSNTVTANTWNYVTVSRVGTTLYLFINGVNGLTQAGYTANLTTSGILRIGTSNDASPAYLPGYISNFRFIKGTGVSSVTVPTTPLTAVSGTSLLTCQSNRFIDNSSNNFTLTVNGNTSVQRLSPFNPTAPYSAATIGGSGYFDGNGDYLTVPDNAALQPPNGDFTYELWWYPTSVSGTQEIFTKGNGVQIYLSGGVMNCALSSNNSSTYFIAASFGAPILNAWNHIALVRSGTTYYGYLNGARTTLGTSASYPGTGTDNVVIGAYGAGLYPTFGYLSNARYTTSAVYTTSPATVPTTPLTAISGTQLLTNFTNAGIPDAAMMNDLETVGNAQVSTSVVKYGTGSLAFDGSGDSLKAASNPSLAFGTGAYTVEFWIYWNALGGGEIISTTNNFGTGYWTFYDNGSVVSVVSTGGAGSMDYTWTGRATGTWYHVAISRESNSTQRLFINGTQVVSGTYANNFGQNGFQVGDGFAADFNGYIDDLRITKGLARYTANFTPPTAALPVY